MKYPDTGKPAPTPETDAEITRMKAYFIEPMSQPMTAEAFNGMLRHARNLERQRDEAKQMLVGEHEAHMQCHAERDALEAALRKVAKLYPDDPGSSDLYDEQPVPMTLGLLRQVWAALSLVEKVEIVNGPSISESEDARRNA